MTCLSALGTVPHVVQDGLKLTMSLRMALNPVSTPKCWDYRLVLLPLASSPFFLLFPPYSYMCLFVCRCMYVGEGASVHGGQRATYGIWFSPSAACVPEAKLQSPDLLSSALTC
jgi:hypothetical protein